nr:COMT protein [Stephania japonica]
MESWGYLKDRVLEGSVPFNMAHGMEIFDYMASDERFKGVFNEGLYNHSVYVMGDLLETYKGFEDGVVGVVVDVGGGTGGSMKMLVSKYPHIKGINFDLPHVIADAPLYPGEVCRIFMEINVLSPLSSKTDLELLRKEGEEELGGIDVKHVSGDMLKGVPNGDIMFMKFILHTFNDEHCVAILKNCWNALPRHGKVLIAEHVLPPTNISEFPDAFRLAFTLDAMMLVYRDGGKERTLVEYEELGKRAGFHGMKAFPCSLGIVAIELQKGS